MAVVPILGILLFYGFVVYFLINVLQFMRNKTKDDRVLIEKMEQLIDLYRTKNIE